MIAFEVLELRHRQPVMAIFNDYVINTFAAFPSRPLPEPFFEKILEKSYGYPAYAVTDGPTVIGFCFLSPYSPMDTFRETATVTYFIAPKHTSGGIGSRALERLLTDARKMGLRHIVAEISSKNEVSLAFHRKHGFEVRGTLRGIGRKHGESFDLVLMQKSLA